MQITLRHAALAAVPVLIAGCGDTSYHATNPTGTPCSVDGVQAVMPAGWTCATGNFGQATGVSFKPKDAQNTAMLFIEDPKKEDASTLSDQSHWKSLLGSAPGAMQAGPLGVVSRKYANVVCYSIPVAGSANTSGEVGVLVGQTKASKYVENMPVTPAFTGADTDDMTKILRSIKID